jgi:hypothetical protein
MTRRGHKRNPDGVGGRLDCSQVRFEGSGGGNFGEKLADRVPEVRKLLRADMTLVQIAAALEVRETTLRKFIKRRNLCDLKQRNFIRTHGVR